MSEKKTKKTEKFGRELGVDKPLRAMRLGP